MEQSVRKAIINSLIENDCYESKEKIDEMVKEIIEFINGQKENYNRSRNNGRTQRQLQFSDSNNEILFEEGTLIHCARKCDFSKLINIKEQGIMAGDFIGIPETGNAETFFCADFYRTPKTVEGKEFFEKVSKSDSVSKRGPFNRGLANILNLAFIIQPDDEIKELMNADMYAPQNSEHTMQNCLHLLPQYCSGNAKSGEVAAIPYGIPANFISGIVAGDFLLTNPQYMEMLNQIFPNCYILNRDGKVFFDPNLSREENETKSQLCLKDMPPIDGVRAQNAAEQLATLLSTFPSRNINQKTEVAFKSEIGLSDINEVTAEMRKDLKLTQEQQISNVK